MIPPIKPPADETIETRRKRLKIRAWRRGIKEMDLLIGGYADAHLAQMDVATLDAFEEVMDEHDQDLLAYVTEQQPVPDNLRAMLDKIVAFAGPQVWLPTGK